RQRSRRRLPRRLAMTVRPARRRGDVACSPRGAVVPSESSEGSVFLVSRDPPPPGMVAAVTRNMESESPQHFLAPSCLDTDRGRAGCGTLCRATHPELLSWVEVAENTGVAC